MYISHSKMIRFLGIFLLLFVLPSGKDAYAVRVYFEEMEAGKYEIDTQTFESHENEAGYVTNTMDLSENILEDTYLPQIEPRAKKPGKGGFNLFSCFSSRSRQPKRTNTRKRRKGNKVAPEQFSPQGLPQNLPQGPPQNLPQKSNPNTGVPPNRRRSNIQTGRENSRDPDPRNWKSHGHHAENYIPSPVHLEPPSSPPPFFEPEMHAMHEFTHGKF